uniref:Uncharacterized protein n=1 Tax=Ascaris lumbricoides TaxID=6252 RepID=A0A0M3IG75_ASCLU
MQAVFVRGRETQNDTSLGTACKFQRAEVMKNLVVMEFSPEEQPSREDQIESSVGEHCLPSNCQKTSIRRAKPP